jgi:restriction system protein
MIIIEGTRVKCKKCSKLHDISPEEFEGPETSSDERSMGYETQYIWEFEFNCDKCNNDLKITIEGYEYPAGILNYQEFNSEGCIIIDEPSLEVNNDNEDYEMD